MAEHGRQVVPSNLNCYLNHKTPYLFLVPYFVYAPLLAIPPSYCVSLLIRNKMIWWTRPSPYPLNEEIWTKQSNPLSPNGSRWKITHRTMSTKGVKQMKEFRRNQNPWEVSEEPRKVAPKLDNYYLYIN